MAKKWSRKKLRAKPAKKKTAIKKPAKTMIEIRLELSEKEMISLKQWCRLNGIKDLGVVAKNVLKSFYVF